ncbi:hypothetical protein [Nocardia xishanensis]
MDLDITCPPCGQIDFVQSVPALHAGGVSTSYGTSRYTGIPVATTGFVPVIGTSTVEHTPPPSSPEASREGPPSNRVDDLQPLGCCS